MCIRDRWFHSGTVVEPWWNRSGTVLEPHAFLVEPGFSALLAPCVFAHFACMDPRPTTPFIILEGIDVRWARVSIHLDSMWCCSRILPRALLHSYALHLSPAWRAPPQPYHVQRAVDVLGCALQAACELPLGSCCKGRVTKGVLQRACSVSYTHLTLPTILLV